MTCPTQTTTTPNSIHNGDCIKTSLHFEWKYRYNVLGEVGWQCVLLLFQLCQEHRTLSGVYYNYAICTLGITYTDAQSYLHPTVSTTDRTYLHLMGPTPDITTSLLVDCSNSRHCKHLVATNSTCIDVESHKHITTFTHNA